MQNGVLGVAPPPAPTPPPKELDGFRVLWMDEIHFAPAKKAWNDDSNVNTKKQWFQPWILRWCEMDFVTIHMRSVIATFGGRACGVATPEAAFRLSLRPTQALSASKCPNWDEHWLENHPKGDSSDKMGKPPMVLWGPGISINPPFTWNNMLTPVCCLCFRFLEVLSITLWDKPFSVSLRR